MLPVHFSANLPLATRSVFRRSRPVLLVGAALGVVLLLGKALPTSLPELVLLGSVGVGVLLGLLLSGWLGQQHPEAGLPPQAAERTAKAAAPTAYQSQEIRCNPFFELFSSSSL